MRELSKGLHGANRFRLATIRGCAPRLAHSQIVLFRLGVLLPKPPQLVSHLS
jgi:hypothetical protein